ncbi:type II toxin-antitoxin system YoeB family toxin [Scytonema sp. UIC 10036]|uniref:type II toxin-antitoxin system YoeB family toxin n=1 Tax=Scytonema sp. UIC 10036 TaxID=2304196 RepID=UPI00325A62CE
MSENLEPEELSQSEISQEISQPDLVFDKQFLEDLTYWVETNRKIALRVLSLVEEIRRNPFEGTGRPERLKYYHMVTAAHSSRSHCLCRE